MRTRLSSLFSSSLHRFGLLQGTRLAAEVVPHQTAPSHFNSFHTMFSSKLKSDLWQNAASNADILFRDEREHITHRFD